MYLETLTEGMKRPKDAQKKLGMHFFKPYAAPLDLVAGAFGPVDALFSDSVPNVFYSILYIGNAIINTLAGIGNLLLAHGKQSLNNFSHAVTSMFLATIAASLIILAPLFEAARFFTRWGATLVDSFSKPKTTDTAENKASAMMSPSPCC
jgi:hypothetical protein